jgi:methanogenic corrinoid protein MtbC1
MDDLDAISQAVAQLDEREVMRLVQTALDRGENSLAIVHAMQDGMQKVGERYEQQEIYLAGLIMAGEIFHSVMTLAQPRLEDELTGHATGRVLLGTVAGDIHDIGKDLAALAFRMFGFTVQDLGVNVPAGTFLAAAREFKPDIVGLSGLLVGAFTAMKDTVALLREHASEIGASPVFIIGGGTIDEQIAEYVATDLWTDNAMEGVRLCQRALEGRRGL